MPHLPAASTPPDPPAARRSPASPADRSRAPRRSPGGICRDRREKFLIERIALAIAPLLSRPSLRRNGGAARPRRSIRQSRWRVRRRRHRSRTVRRRADRTASSRASAASGAGYSNSTVKRPCPRFGSTCSTSTLLKISDQVSSSVIRTRALAAAASAARSPSPSADRGQQIDPGKALECRRHRQQFRLGERIGRPAAKREPPDPGRLRRMRDHDDAVGHHGVIACVRAVPFQHGEFGQMQVAALAVAEHARKLEYLWPRRRRAISWQANSGEVRK